MPAAATCIAVAKMSAPGSLTCRVHRVELIGSRHTPGCGDAIRPDPTGHTIQTGVSA
jgi:hypothetical protein